MKAAIPNWKDQAAHRIVSATLPIGNQILDSNLHTKNAGRLGLKFDMDNSKAVEDNR
jgi:hypothetical protein